MSAFPFTGNTVESKGSVIETMEWVGGWVDAYTNRLTDFIVRYMRG
jgi:hypothetical protein